MRCRSPGAATWGMGSSETLQVSRRTAVTTVAVVVTTSAPSASVCSTDSVQCWVERLVRTGVACKV
ncbi:hypothetical protein D3C85_1792150 [compost metagenome]